MLDLVSKRFWFFLLSAVIIVPGIVSLGLFGLNWGIDFSSGSSMTLRFDNPPGQGELREKMSALGYEDAVIQRTGSGDYIVRTREIGREEKDKIETGLKEAYGSVTTLDFGSVSASVASQVRRLAVLAVLAASVGMLIYISLAFRRIPHSSRYGACAVIAIVYSSVVTLGAFSLLGKFANVQLDALFIAAVLTVVGYGVNDTIVVFDRIRENVSRGINKEYPTIVNISLAETLPRSINTVLTVLFTLSALYLLGGATIRNFVLAMLIGVAVATYTSIFMASQLLIVWHKGEWGRFLPWRKPGTGPAPAK